MFFKHIFQFNNNSLSLRSYLIVKLLIMLPKTSEMDGILLDQGSVTDHKLLLLAQFLVPLSSRKF